VTLCAWSDEICKIAVSTRQLAGIVRRVGAVTPSRLQKTVKGLPKGKAKNLSWEQGGAFTIPTRRVQKKITMKGDALLRDAPGTVVVSRPKDLAAVGKNQAGGWNSPKTPEGRRSLRDMITAHESFERQVRPKDFSSTMANTKGHASIDVLMKERNMLNKLKGPGAKEAVRALRTTRNARGESRMLRNELTGAYGPRAHRFLNPGQKIPKAMRKDMLRRARSS
jgi:hypothetical protein